MVDESTPTEERWTLEAVVQATAARPLTEAGPGFFTGISTDSRTLQPGDLFVALEGERFDGHQFLGQAAKRGAAGIMIASRKVETLGPLPSHLSALAVPDTLEALGRLAAFWRRRYSLPLVAITGSNGKTTTKEMVAAILSRRWRILKNQGNLNNLVGLPLTLLQLRRHHQAAVVEMGMNRPGEIARLTGIARPDVGLITNIQPAHLQGLGSLAGIQAAKGELFANLPAAATIVVNRDDPRVVALASSFPGRQVRFSTSGAEAEVILERIVSLERDGSRFVIAVAGRSLEIYLPIIGRHHLGNAVAAAAVGWALGLPPDGVAAALADFRPVSKRMEVFTTATGVHIINDTYNANPASMAAALETLSRMSKGGRAVAVLGDMLELGSESAALHRQVGGIVAKQGIDHLLALGSQAAHFLDGAAQAGMAGDCLELGSGHRQLARRLEQLLAPGDWVLVKGSRGIQMEKVVEALVEAQDRGGAAAEGSAPNPAQGC